MTRRRTQYADDHVEAVLTHSRDAVDEGGRFWRPNHKWPGSSTRQVNDFSQTAHTTWNMNHYNDIIIIFQIHNTEFSTINTMDQYTIPPATSISFFPPLESLVSHFVLCDVQFTSANAFASLLKVQGKKTVKRHEPSENVQDNLLIY